MNKKLTIAMDGAAAAGKSTVALHLSHKLNYLYLDTGVMYRAVTWQTLVSETDVNDEARVSAIAEAIQITVTPDQADDGRPYTVWVGEQDVTWAIREKAIDQNVSRVSSYPRVRATLTAQQREMAEMGGIIMVGRDIGTVVLPQADLKLFMEASAEERAKRRYRERLEQGKAANYEDILQDIELRDKQDREKPISPLVPADDAVIVDTDGRTIDEVVEAVLELVSQKH